MYVIVDTTRYGMDLTDECIFLWNGTAIPERRVPAFQKSGTGIPAIRLVPDPCHRSHASISHCRDQCFQC